MPIAIRSAIGVVGLFACIQFAHAFDAILIVPPADSPEANVLSYYQVTGAVPNLGLSLIPAHIQRELLAIIQSDTGRAKCEHRNITESWALTKEECAEIFTTDTAAPQTRLASVVRAIRSGAFNDPVTGSWVLEDSAQVADEKIRAFSMLSLRMFGIEDARRFVAAHELGHATLRAIVASGRLQKELPDSFAALSADDVFQETFCDLMALAVMGEHRSPADQAQLAFAMSSFRRQAGEMLIEDAPFLLEVADLLDGYAHALQRGQLLSATVDEQITGALHFLAISGVFESMLAGQEEWRRIQNEGCFDCFQRRQSKPVANSGGT